MKREDNNFCVICNKKIINGIMCNKSHNEDIGFYRIYDKKGDLIKSSDKCINVNDYTKMMEKEFKK